MFCAGERAAVGLTPACSAGGNASAGSHAEGLLPFWFKRKRGGFIHELRACRDPSPPDAWSAGCVLAKHPTASPPSIKHEASRYLLASGRSSDFPKEQSRTSSNLLYNLKKKNVTQDASNQFLLSGIIYLKKYIEKCRKKKEGVSWSFITM